MPHRKTLWFLIFLVTMSLLMTGCFSKPAQDTKNPTPLHGVIDMEKAVMSHPKYQELKAVEKKINTLTEQAKIQNMSKAAEQVSAGDLSGMDDYISQQFSSKMAQKQYELKQELDQKAAKVQNELAGELAAYNDELDSIYGSKLFNIQLKLKTLQLTKEQAESLQNEMAVLQKERAENYQAKETELVKRMDDILAPEKKALEEKLNAYAQKLSGELNAERAKKLGEISERQPNTAVQSDLEHQIGLLKREAETVQNSIIDDIRNMTAEVAAKRNIDTVFTNVRVNVSAVDVTLDVIAKFKK